MADEQTAEDGCEDNQKVLMELAYSDSLTGLRNFAGFKT